MRPATGPSLEEEVVSGRDLCGADRWEAIWSQASHAPTGRLLERRRASIDC
jgi:hypothetical protein